LLKKEGRGKRRKRKKHSVDGATIVVKIEGRPFENAILSQEKVRKGKRRSSKILLSILIKWKRERKHDQINGR